MPKKTLSQEEVVAAYLLKKIALESTYIGAATKNKLKCLVCGHQWQAPYNSLSSGGSGCPKCAGRVPLSHEIVREKYLSSKILLKSQYKTSGQKDDLECLVCGYQWQMLYGNFRSTGRGCPKCAGKAPLSHEFVKKQYLSSKILLKSQYKTRYKKNDLECVTCNYEWQSSYNIFSRGSGCSKCHGNAPLSHEFVKKQYLAGGILLKSQYKNFDHKNDLECLVCGHTWQQGYIRFRSYLSGCPSCGQERTKSRAWQSVKYLDICAAKEGLSTIAGLE